MITEYNAYFKVSYNDREQKREKRKQDPLFISSLLSLKHRLHIL